ncbi:MAG: choloylglycine hydrolase family protein [Ruminococcaceae bacterium]|nr:choloylglycine hydrolase family protein [Oscillospiraceae bacterium]
MCTAVSFKTDDFYFGRTLDHDVTFGEQVTITPRSFPFHFKHEKTIKDHYAIIGMAHIAEGYPLYYDAVNEKGLCIAGLNFTQSAVYRDFEEGKHNASQSELIPWILSKCKNVSEATALLEKTNVCEIPFSDELGVAKLHWLIADKDRAVTVEAVAEGLKIYENPVGVLTNEPPFDRQLFGLNNYMSLSPKEPTNSFSKELPLKIYSRGMGAMGLPGDLSSASRFVRASFIKMNSASGSSEPESVSQFFHILNSVSQPRGCCNLGGGKYEITVYTSCCNADKGIYYYTTYENSGVCAVTMKNEDLDGNELICYPLIDKMQTFLQN